jgi:hypothetical protein
MNRHIYGLTLFLFIVKIHFLLYWAFFAPINFFSSQDIPSPAIVAPFQIEKSKSCKMRNNRQIDLRNVEVNIKEGKLYANAGFPDLGNSPDLKGKRYVLHIHSFSPPYTSGGDWIGEIIPTAQIKEGSVAFVRSSPELKQINPKISYFAQIELLSEHWESPHAPFIDVQDLTPVLINADKNGFGR